MERLSFDGPCLFTACDKTGAHSHAICPRCGSADVLEEGDVCVALGALPPALRAQVEAHLRESRATGLDS